MIVAAVIVRGGDLVSSCVVYNAFGSCSDTKGEKTCNNGKYDACQIKGADPRIATCSEKQCGSDGCNGFCKDGQLSSENTLSRTCPKTFGTCSVPGSQYCNSSTNKYDVCQAADPRVINCSGKQCGTDGCGGTCGICSSNSQCVNGKCVCVTKPGEGTACGKDSCGVDHGECDGWLESCHDGTCSVF